MSRALVTYKNDVEMEVAKARTCLFIHRGSRLRTPSMEQNERTVFLLRIERNENGTISKKS